MIVDNMYILCLFEELTSPGDESNDVLHCIFISQYSRSVRLKGKQVANVYVRISSHDS